MATDSDFYHRFDSATRREEAHMGSYGNQGGKRGLITDYPGDIEADTAAARARKGAISSTVVTVPTARGLRPVTVEDLGQAIDALASRLSDIEEVLREYSGNGVTGDDVSDAELLLRINPEYSGICNPIIAAYEAEEGE